MHHVEEASGYQIHANTELEGCRKVESQELETGGAKSVFLPKIDLFGKTDRDRDIYFAIKVQLQIINLHNQQMKIK